MTKQEFASRLQNACAAVTAAEQELTEIDSRFGEADHGLTMSKIAGAISGALEEPADGIQEMLDGAAMAVMEINGGRAVPLWNTWLDGMQENAPAGGEIDAAGLKAMFAGAYEALADISGAKGGDKTRMDALIPATEAIAAYDGADEAGLLAAAAAAAARLPASCGPSPNSRCSRAAGAMSLRRPRQRRCFRSCGTIWSFCRWRPILRRPRTCSARRARRIRRSYHCCSTPSMRSAGSACRRSSSRRSLSCAPCA